MPQLVKYPTLRKGAEDEVDGDAEGGSAQQTEKNRMIVRTRPCPKDEEWSA